MPQPGTRKNSLVGALMLTVCAIVWGSSFAAQSVGAQYVEPFTFISLRSLLGAVTLLPVIALRTKAQKKDPAFKEKRAEEKQWLPKGGLVCGIVLSAASLLQQFGIDRGTASGKAGFITALYILMVPIFSVVLRKRIRPVIWPCAVTSLVGLYLLCVNDSTVQPSDGFVLACAVMYAIHILVIDHVSPHVDGVRLSCVQFFVAGVLSAGPMLLTEDVSFDLIKSAAVSIVYSGVMSSGVAFTLQILGQQRTEPTVATMIMSLESVFAMLTGMVLLHEMPTAKETVGCVLMFAAIIVAQWPEKSERTSR
ncbi:MAG: DMT family transporter [Clostridia bacterium]|nr:DMT family transporter [Clostridia bacterium]